MCSHRLSGLFTHRRGGRLLEGDGVRRCWTDVQFQIVVGVVEVADDRVAVGADRNRREVADGAARFERLVGASGAGRVVAHVQLQIEVGVVLVADDRVAVGPDRNRRVRTDVVGRFERLVGAGGADRNARTSHRFAVSERVLSTQAASTPSIVTAGFDAAAPHQGITAQTRKPHRVQRTFRRTRQHTSNRHLLVRRA